MPQLQNFAQTLIDSATWDHVFPEVFSTLWDSGLVFDFPKHVLPIDANEDGNRPLLQASDMLLNRLDSDGELDDQDLSFIAHLLYVNAQTAHPKLSQLSAVATIEGMKNTSFDTQCLVLRVLLACPRDFPGRDQRVFEALSRICESWWQGKVTYSQSYSRMSFAWALAEVQSQIEQGILVPPPYVGTSNLLSEHAPIVLTQMASLVLVTRREDERVVSDCLCKPAEEIAQDVITLLALSSFPWMDILREEIEEAIKERRNIVCSIFESDRKLHLSTTSLGYVLSALGKQPASRLAPAVEAYNNQMTAKLNKFAHYFMGANFMKGESTVSIKAAILEGSFYTSLLQKSRADIFPLTSSKEKDKYLNYIPTSLLFQSTYFEQCLAPQWLFDIMLWSMFIFLVDEYMEKNVATFSVDELEEMRAGIEKIHPEPDCRYSIIRVAQLPFLEKENEPQAKNTQRVETALSVFYNWVGWVLNWDRLEKATRLDMNEFRSEIKKYLLFHVRQATDNRRLEAQQPASLDDSVTSPHHEIICFDTPQTGYPTWIHTVGGGHISAPVSHAMSTCYIGSCIRGGKDGWSSVAQRMIAYELNAHIGAYCRIYNDYGSIARDTNEGNLNSINFPEFWSDPFPEWSEGGDAEEEEAAKAGDYHRGDMQNTVKSLLKRSLLEVGQHERDMACILEEKLYSSLDGERNEEGKRIISYLRVYSRSAGMFSDMYLTHDVTNTVK